MWEGTSEWNEETSTVAMQEMETTVGGVVLQEELFPESTTPWLQEENLTTSLQEMFTDPGNVSDHLQKVVSAGDFITESLQEVFLDARNVTVEEASQLQDEAGIFPSGGNSCWWEEYKEMLFPYGEASPAAALLVTGDKILYL